MYLKPLFVIALLVFLAGTPLAAQQVTIRSIDASAFPLMRATITLNDARGIPAQGNIADIHLRDNGILQTLTSITCKEDSTTAPISSVLTLDISLSMDSSIGTISRLDAARLSALEWVNRLGATSECAVTAFCDWSMRVQDFTTNKPLLRSQINALSMCMGTNYQAGFYEQRDGGLIVAREGRYKRVLLFLTDGQSRTPTYTDQIIAEANSQGCVVYAVVVGMPCPQELQDIVAGTGGRYFENIRTAQSLVDAFLDIQKASTSISACEITWISQAECAPTDRLVELEWKGATAQRSYLAPATSVAPVHAIPAGITLPVLPGRSAVDTTITIVAGNTDVVVYDIQASNPAYGISPTSFKLAANTSRNVTITYMPASGAEAWSDITILTDGCPAYARIRTAERDSIRITHPNGYEAFLTNSDTLITWAGVSPATNVDLSLSLDAGQSWQRLYSDVQGLVQPWHVPNTPSATCLMRVETFNDGAQRTWYRSTGGTSTDVGTSMAVYTDGTVYTAGSGTGALYDGDARIVPATNATDAFLVKRRPTDGSVMWTATVTGTGEETFTDIALDGRGNIYALGVTTSPSVIAGSRTTRARTDTATVFLARYTPAGNAEWIRSIGSNNGQMAVDAAGNVVVACNATSASSDILVVRYNALGNLVWQRTIGNTGSKSVAAIGAGADGSSYVCVNDATTQTPLVVRYTNNGTLAWQNAVASGQGHVAQAMTVTPDGTLCIATLSTNAQAPGVQLYGLDTQGIPQWRTGLAVSGNTTALTADAAGTIYASLAFDAPVEMGRMRLRSRGGRDIALLAVNGRGGTVTCVAHAGGSGDDVCTDVAITPSGRPILAGYYTDTLNINGNVLGSRGGSDAFTWYMGEAPKLTDESDTLWAIVDLRATVRVADVVASVGDITDVPVTVTAPQTSLDFGLRSISVTLRARANVFYPTDESLPIRHIGDYVEIDLEVPAEHINGSPLLLPVRALFAQDSVTPIDVVYTRSNGAPVFIEEFPGSFTVTGVCYEAALRSTLLGMELLFAELSPNVVTSQGSTLTFNTSAAGTMECYVVDITGRRVATVLNRMLSADSYSIPVPLNDVAPGSYLLVLDGRNGRRVLPFEIRR